MSRVYFEEPGALVAPEDSGRRSHVPIRVWARSLDEATIRQLREIASQPYVVLHVAAMADAHVAEGVAVGTVFATENTVVPSALGGDLGCGMSALRLDVRWARRATSSKDSETSTRSVRARTARAAS